MKQRTISLLSAVVVLVVGFGGRSHAQAVGDTCETARVVTNVVFARNNFNLVNNTNALSGPSCNVGGKDEIWVITPPVAAAGRVITASSLGSVPSTIVSVWRGSCADLEEIACATRSFDDNFPNGEVEFTADGVSTYYIVLEGLNGQTGEVDLTIDGP